MLECKSEVPYVITLERELSQMPLKMRFLDVKQVREGGLQYFYAVIANFRHARRLVEEGVRQILLLCKTEKMLQKRVK